MHGRRNDASGESVFVTILFMRTLNDKEMKYAPSENLF